MTRGQRRRRHSWSVYYILDGTKKNLSMWKKPWGRLSPLHWISRDERAWVRIEAPETIYLCDSEIVAGFVRWTSNSWEMRMSQFDLYVANWLSTRSPTTVFNFKVKFDFGEVINMSSCYGLFQSLQLYFTVWDLKALEFSSQMVPLKLSHDL